MEYIEIEFPQSGWTKFTPTSPGGILSISKFRRSISLFSPNLENQSLTVVFNNLKGFWSEKIRSEDRYLLGKRIRYWKASQLRGTFYICDFPKPNDMCEFVIKADLFKSLEYKLSKRITLEDYPEMPNENDGKYGNIVAGIVSDVGWKDKGQITAVKVAPLKYHAAIHHLWNVESVYDGDGAALLYSYDNNADGNCYINILQAGFEETEVYFNGGGLMDSQGYLVTNPGSQLFSILEVSGGDVQVNLSIEVIQELERFVGVGILITEQNLKEFLKEFSLQFSAVFYLQADGEIGTKLLSWDNLTPDYNLTQSQINAYIEYPDPSDVLKSISRKYRYHYQDKDYGYIPVSEIITPWAAKEKELELYYHTDALCTHDVAITELFLKKDQVWRISFEVLEKLVIGIDVTQKIALRLIYGERIVYVDTIEPVDRGKLRIAGFDLTPLFISQFFLLEEVDPDVAILMGDTDHDCRLLM